MAAVAAQPQLEGVHDGAGDLVLDGEDVLQLPVVVLFSPISRTSAFLPLKAKQEVRAATWLKSQYL